MSKRKNAVGATPAPPAPAPDADPDVFALEQEVPAALRGRFREIVAATDAFCDTRLTAEYKSLCRELAAVVCQPGSPVTGGKGQGWAAGIVYCVGWVNFLSDPSHDPHMRLEDIAKPIGTSVATMHNKAKVIRDGLNLRRLDPEWTLPSKLADNPFVWMLPTTDGLITDVRLESREVQEEALRLGLIPFLPPPRKTD